jgi:hypothetical protein
MSLRLSVSLGLFVLVGSVFVQGHGQTAVKGPCADVFGGSVCTWATTDDGALVDVGATVPLATIEGAPAHVPMAWPPVPAGSIDLPDAARDQSALRQLTVNWEAGGHPPASFLTPHFDFNVYAVSPAEFAAIDCRDDSKPGWLPAGYALPDIPLPEHMAHMMGVPALIGLCVPRMGMHGIPQIEVTRTEAFEGTMVVGYYRGRPIFVEPMIAKATLMKRASFELPMPVVTGMTGAMPSTFRAEYDAGADAYQFRFSGFHDVD